MKRELNISYSGYKYAPELCNIFVNGKLYAKRGTQTAHDIAYMLITGKEKEAADTIKRQIRQEYKKPKYITIGFYKEGSKSDYIFTRQLYANKDNLNDKLFIYKEFKHFLQDQNATIQTHEVTTGNFIPGEKAPATTTIIQEKADLKRPVIINLI